ncbi:P-loop NTPase fold protein [Paenimyroides baculatum]|uniref:AAA+ ATPase domain-containing protein n=1 Tax=Paenimyroides baculatum TaxID=2608000 RepID=A0A5M6CNR2_9FLAO|nr:P-loop NTPase fold protein [Paenimyroides baculatum]KAA5535612.1 hypothetical protein F0460_07470 [Paenimyroides baculatum]
MIKNNTNIIPNNLILQDFKRHLNLDSNNRILFTAPFGSGKSTFIQEFAEKYNHNYRFIKLYPVNYAVASNEDIFELVKFDVLFELMSKFQNEISLEKTDFDFWLRAAMFMQNRVDFAPILLNIISLHEKIGKPVATFLNQLKSIVGDFKAYTKEININEADDVLEFLESFKNIKGGIHEMDATSQFIYDIVDRLKGSEVFSEEDEEKSLNTAQRENKTILVIDDLDRLDPDHIFRLFNIFSAHTNFVTDENKFGFDKVIFVCDLDNIQKIYYHKYGKDVDFGGYIDKFYSIEPFKFDKSEELSNYIEGFVSNIKVKNCDSEFTKATLFKNSVIALIKILIHYEIVNLRSLNTLSFIEIDYKKTKKRKIIPVLVLFQILDAILKTDLSKNNFLDKLNLQGAAYKQFNRYTNIYEYYLSIDEINDFQDALFHLFVGIDKDDEESDYLYLKELDLSVRYTLGRSNYVHYSRISLLGIGDFNPQRDGGLRFNLNHLLKYSYQSYRSSK